MKLDQIRKSDQYCQSVLRNFQGSYRKGNLITKYIQGMDVSQALFALEHMRNKWAIPTHKLVKAALNDAQQKNISGQMVIAHAFTCKSHEIKRLEIKGRGRTGTRKKPYCHITVILSKKVVQ